MSIFDTPMTDSQIAWDASFDNTTKIWDYDRPFHRIQSPSFNKRTKQVDGKGYDCGCRSPSDFDQTLVEFIFAQGVRMAPSWVPTARRGYDPNYQEGVEEIEGVLWHSFQTWTDVPTYEWHRWYDWNLHVIPAPPYDWLRGQGNEVQVVPALDLTVWKPMGSERAMELEWDTGAFGHRPGSMFDPSTTGDFDTAHDWVWPQTGQYVWAVGRHIYDCGHANSKDPGHGDDKNQGLMRSELHPLLAVASARWRAVKFDENSKPVPAIQFMFFTSRKGGYWDYETVKPGGYNAQRSANPDACKDYEFIVDLPKATGDAQPTFAIGHTPDFPLNTLVLRPQLLIHFDDSPFQSAAGSVTPYAQAIPEITLIPPTDPASLPQQVKIKLPISSLPDSTDAYGVIVSLGWRDPDGDAAANVRKVTVTLDHFQHGQFIRDKSIFSGKDEWDLKIGINGQWHYVSTPDDSLTRGTNFPLNGKKVELFLALDDYLYITTHGVERNLEFDFMARPSNNRRFKSGSGEDTMHTLWKPEVDQPDHDIAASTALTAITTMAATLKQLNEAIGIIDNAVAATGSVFAGNAKNPIKVRDLIAQIGEGNAQAMQIAVPHATEDEHSAELFYNPNEVDYTLFYSVKVDPLP